MVPATGTPLCPQARRLPSTRRPFSLSGKAVAPRVTAPCGLPVPRVSCISWPLGSTVSRGPDREARARWRRSRIPRSARRRGRCSPTSTRPPWRWATGARAGRATPPNSSSSSATARSAAPSPWPRGCATACASCAPSACGTQVPTAPRPRQGPHQPDTTLPFPSRDPTSALRPRARPSPRGPLSPPDVQFLASVLPPDTDPAFFEHLRALDCSGVTVRALPEGSLAFPGVSAG